MKLDSPLCTPGSGRPTEIEDSQGESLTKEVLDNSQSSQLVITIQSSSDIDISLRTSPNRSSIGSPLKLTISPAVMNKKSADWSTPGPSGKQPMNKPSFSSPRDLSITSLARSSSPARATSSKTSSKRSSSRSSVESPQAKRRNARNDTPSVPSAEAQLTPVKESTPECESPVTPSNRDLVLNLFLTDDPSPYKSIRPKFLPKNCKQHKKKYEERQKYMDSVKAIEEKWSKRTLADLVPASTPEQESVNTDPFGLTISQLRWFRPERYFVSFDEESLNANDFVPPDSPLYSKSCREIFVYLQSASNYTPTAEECRFFFYWLTVTKKSHIVGFVTTLFHNRFQDGSLYLGWQDTKKILINFGLVKEPPQLVGAAASGNRQGGPQLWNLESFLFFLEHSYALYKTHMQMKLLIFLLGVLFEPLFSPLRSRLASLANKTMALLISKNVDKEKLLNFIDLGFCPNSCNRYLFQMMSSDPALGEISQAFAKKVVEGALNGKMDAGSKVTGCKKVLDFLEENRKALEELDFKILFQVVMIAEKLLLMGKAETLRSERANRLSTLLREIGQNRNHFDRLYLDEVIRRVKAVV